MISFVADISLSTRGMYCDSRQECCDRIGVGRYGQNLCHLTLRERERVDFAGIAARDKNAPPILAERQAVPGLGERQELCDTPAGNVQQCQPRVAKPATHRNQRFLVWRNQELQREIADWHCAASRSDAPAIEEQVGVWLEPWPAADCRVIDIFGGFAYGRRLRPGSSAWRKQQRRQEQES